MATTEKKMNDREKGESNDTNTSLKKTLFLGFTPLVIAILFYIILSLCIYISRYYLNWRMKKQLAIVRCSEQCFILSNPSIDYTDQQIIPQVV